MIAALSRWLLVLDVPLILAGCKAGSVDKSNGADDEAAIEAALAELSRADRKLAKDQMYCAVENSNRLGSMGQPVKVMMSGQPVFLCCDGCRKKAVANPDKTLACVQSLREKAHSPPAK